MKHADKLGERILMLDGLPNLQHLGRLMIGTDVPEVLTGDLMLERGSQVTLKAGIAHCAACRTTSRALLSSPRSAQRADRKRAASPRRRTLREPRRAVLRARTAGRVTRCRE